MWTWGHLQESTHNLIPKDLGSPVTSCSWFLFGVRAKAGIVPAFALLWLTVDRFMLKLEILGIISEWLNQ